MSKRKLGVFACLAWLAGGLLPVAGPQASATPLIADDGAVAVAVETDERLQAQALDPRRTRHSDLL